MEMRITREKLAECYRTEGVNSYEQCAHLAQKVLDQIPDGRVSISFLSLFCFLNPKSVSRTPLQQ